MIKTIITFILFAFKPNFGTYNYQVKEKLVVFFHGKEYNDSDNILGNDDTAIVKILNDGNLLYSINKIELRGTIRYADQVIGKYVISDHKEILNYPDEFLKNPAKKIGCVRWGQHLLTKIKIKILEIKQKKSDGSIVVNPPSIHKYNKVYKFYKPLK